MRFRVLGLLEVHSGDGEIVRLRAAKQRTLLVLLLLHANRPVSADRLAEALWPGGPPRSAAGNMRTYVSVLRRVLCLDGADRLPRLTAGSGGYRLDLEPSELDLLVFDDLSASGRRALRNGDPVAAAGMLGEALTLWRGRPGEDVVLDGGTAGMMAELEERRLAVEEAWVDAQLMLGNDAELITRLQGLVVHHPLRERLWGQLMTALYRTGRQAEALAAFQRLRQQVADELGVEPGPHLQQIQQQILKGGPLESTSPAAVPLGARVAVPPAQLPPGIESFAGRTAQLRRLDKVLATRGTDDARSPVICAITGMAGVGKTTLAVHWAHQVSSLFPDGQLYVDLRGFGPGPPMDPGEAVRGFLASLGVAHERMPDQLPAQIGLYRSMLAGRRMLVVLDNTSGSGQVRPLLPGSAGCLVVVTSRDRLDGLAAGEDADVLGLDELTDAQAASLLASRIGTERLDAEPDAVGEIITSCGGLPLALAIVAARARSRPEFPLAAIAAQIRDAGGLLGPAGTADPVISVEAALSWSYSRLDPGAARMFRLTGLHPGPDFSPPTAASLAAIPLRAALPVIAGLNHANLLTERLPGRYTSHDLLRQYAADLSTQADDDAERRAALGRMLDHYLHTADIARRLLLPHWETIALGLPRPGTVTEGLADDRQAVTWLTTERAALQATVHLASSSGLDAYAWQLPWVVGGFYLGQGRWHELAAMQETAVSAAARLGDQNARAMSHRALGAVYVRLGRRAEARAHLRHALSLFEQLGDIARQARTHGDLASAAQQQGRNAGGLRHAEAALELFRHAGDVAGQARALNAVGWHGAVQGDYQRGLVYSQQALDLQRKLGDRYGEVDTWDSLGYCHYHLGDHRQAADCYRHVIDLFAEVGDHYNQARTLIRFGEVQHANGDTSAGRRTWEEALRILEHLGHPQASELRARLG